MSSVHANFTPGAALTLEEAERTVSKALAAAPGTPVIVDFDETLWLRNSTEEYLRSLRPSWLAHLVLLALEVVRPWKFLSHPRGEHVYRDWLRVLCCTLVMPWGMRRWRRDAQENADRWANRRLMRILAGAGRSPLLVATLGTDVVVEPLLRSIDPTAVLCAAGSLWSGYRVRLVGKRSWIERNHEHIALADAVVISDSDTDADLFGGCRTPVLVKWPEAEYRPAMADAYVPFRYTQRAKRPGENYMLYGVLLEDVVLLWLALAWFMPSPLPGALGLLFLHLSLWAVYEIGYVENDTLAVKHEAKPKTFDVAAAYAERFSAAKAWLVSLVLGAVGMALLAWANAPALELSRFVASPLRLALAGFVAWMAYVLASRIAFWLYNRLDTGTRGHFYVVLQLFRLLGYGAMISANWVGAMLLMSLVLGRWVKYLVYRSAGRTFDEDQRFLTLMFFVLLLVMGLAAGGPELLGLQAAVGLIWLAAYAHRRMRALLSHLRFTQFPRG